MERKPLVLDTDGQVEQMPAGDWLNNNIGDPQLIVVNSSIIVADSQHHTVFSLVNRNVDTILGGVPNQIYFFRGFLGTSRITFRKGVGNIFGGSNRQIREETDVMVLLYVDFVGFVEVSWSS